MNIRSFFFSNSPNVRSPDLELGTMTSSVSGRRQSENLDMTAVASSQLLLASLRGLPASESAHRCAPQPVVPGPIRPSPRSVSGFGIFGEHFFKKSTLLLGLGPVLGSALFLGLRGLRQHRLPGAIQSSVVCQDIECSTYGGLRNYTIYVSTYGGDYSAVGTGSYNATQNCLTHWGDVNYKDPPQPANQSEIVLANAEPYGLHLVHWDDGTTSWQNDCPVTMSPSLGLAIGVSAGLAGLLAVAGLMTKWVLDDRKYQVAARDYDKQSESAFTRVAYRELEDLVNDPKQASGAVWGPRLLPELTQILKRACATGHAALVDDVLRTKIPPNHRLPDGSTPLGAAISHRQLEIVKKLRAHGAKASSDEIEMAAITGDAELFLQVVAGTTAAQNNAGLPADLLIHFASSGTSLKKVLVWLGPDAKVFVDYKDPQGRTPLHFARFWGHKSQAKALIAAGADPEHRDQYGKAADEVALLRSAS